MIFTSTSLHPNMVAYTEMNVDRRIAHVCDSGVRTYNIYDI